MVKNKLPAADVTEDPHYHDTWTLLRKYRDVVWSLEVSVRQVRNRFRIDYGKTIEDFLESVYLAGADLSGTELEHQAKCIEQSHKMLCLVDSAVDLMRAKHKNGEEFYWLLYYSYLSPQELQNVEEIIDQLRPHIRDISPRTYYRKRKEAVEVLSSVLWGYTAQDSAGIVREFLQYPRSRWHHECAGHFRHLDWLDYRQLPVVWEVFIPGNIRRSRTFLAWSCQL